MEGLYKKYQTLFYNEFLTSDSNNIADKYDVAFDKDEYYKNAYYIS